MKSPREDSLILEPLQVRNRNKNEVLTTAPMIDRGLTIEECKALCTSPVIPVRERAFFRVIYD